MHVTRRNAAISQYAELQTQLCTILDWATPHESHLIEDNRAALRSLTSHQSPQAASADGGQSKWATQEELHSNETAGADSSKESLLWSKFTVITSPLSWDAVSFFRNIGKSWAQRKLNVVLSFPSWLAAMVEWDQHSKCLIWWFENLYCESNQRSGNVLCMQDKNNWAELNNWGN